MNVARKVLDVGRAGGATELRVTKGRLNQDCIDAFKRYMCSINFPRCDENEESLGTCESTCMNLFYTCGFSKDLYRCGRSEFFNGGEGAHLPRAEGGGGSPEAKNLPLWIQGAWLALGGASQLMPGKRYWRDYFPGQPFRPNEFEPYPNDDPTIAEGEPIPVCTPSIKGSGVRSGVALVVVSMVGAVMAVTI